MIVRRETGRSAMPIRLALALLATLAAVALDPPSALAGPADAAATRTYIRANYRLMQAAASRIAPIEATLRGVLAQVRRECPMAAANSPQDTDSEQLSNEVIGDMVLTAGRLILPAARKFGNAVGHLTWSNPELTRTIHAYVNKGRRLLALGPPRLCSDIESWAASGFRTLPASTIAFDAAFMPNWVAPGELPAALGPYESAAERPLLLATKHLEEEFTDLEAREVETWSEIMNTLVLQP
jgi:hypothetical protein